MAYEIPGFSFTLPASTGILNNQFRFVTINASGQAAFPANGAAIVGVMNTKPVRAGEAVSVVNTGIVKVEALSSTVGLGDIVAASSVGLVIADSTARTAVGRVVDGSSGGTGRVLSILLTGNDDS